jgi:hypothetical protein
MPEEYYYTLYDSGTLTYGPGKEKPAKGHVNLSWTVFIKLVDLKSQSAISSEKQEVIRAFRIRRFSNNFIYCWANN